MKANEPETESDTDVWMNGGWKTEQYWRTHHRRPADLSREPSAKPRHGETRLHFKQRTERHG